MRALSEDVKLVCCDEPSAALDPRAEARKHSSFRVPDFSADRVS